MFRALFNHYCPACSRVVLTRLGGFALLISHSMQSGFVGFSMRVIITYDILPHEMSFACYLSCPYLHFFIAPLAPSFGELWSTVLSFLPHLFPFSSSIWPHFFFFACSPSRAIGNSVSHLGVSFLVEIYINSLIVFFAHLPCYLHSEIASFGTTPSTIDIL